MGQRPNEHRLSPRAYLRTSHQLSVPGPPPPVPPLSASSSFLTVFASVISGARWVLQAAQQGVPSSLLCSSAWIISQKISFILWLLFPPSLLQEPKTLCMPGSIHSLEVSSLTLIWVSSSGSLRVSWPCPCWGGQSSCFRFVWCFQCWDWGYVFLVVILWRLTYILLGASYQEALVDGLHQLSWLD